MRSWNAQGVERAIMSRVSACVNPATQAAMASGMSGENLTVATSESSNTRAEAEGCRYAYLNPT